MDIVDWAVIAAGVAGIAAVNWYFLLADRQGTAASIASASVGGDPAVTIVVQGGYDPGTVRVPVGRPVRLTFDRRETSSCSEEIVIPRLGVRRYLPANERTTIVVTAPEAGTYELTCGMSMLHGRLIAE